MRRSRLLFLWGLETCSHMETRQVLFLGPDCMQFHPRPFSWR